MDRVMGVSQNVYVNICTKISLHVSSALEWGVPPGDTGFFGWVHVWLQRQLYSALFHHLFHNRGVAVRLLNCATFLQQHWKQWAHQLSKACQFWLDRSPLNLKAELLCIYSLLVLVYQRQWTWTPMRNHGQAMFDSSSWNRSQSISLHLQCLLNLDLGRAEGPMCMIQPRPIEFWIHSSNQVATLKLHSVFAWDQKSIWEKWGKTEWRNCQEVQEGMVKSIGVLWLFIFPSSMWSFHAERV